MMMPPHLFPGDLLALEQADVSVWDSGPDDVNSDSEGFHVLGGFALVIFVHPRRTWIYIVADGQLGWLYYDWIVEVYRDGERVWHR